MKQFLFELFAAAQGNENAINGLKQFDKAGL